MDTNTRKRAKKRLNEAIKEMKEINDMLRERNPYTWYTATYNESDIYLAYSCPNCHKKISLEERFIKPLLPKKINCPYCGENMNLPKETDK